MERIPAPGDLYRHVTDKIYQVITVAAHADSGERMIVYQAMFGEFGIFTMPLARFLGSTDSQQHLFEKIERTDIPYQRPERTEADRNRYEPETDGRNMQQYQSVTAEEQDSGVCDRRQQVQNTVQPQVHTRNTAQPQIHAQNTVQPQMHAQNTVQPHAQNTVQPQMHAQNTVLPQMHAQNTVLPQSCVRERPHVQRPADSRRIFSQDPAEGSGGAYYEKRQRQMEEREQRRGMFRKTERHETATEELHANPCLLKFLEADTYEERFHVLNQIQDEITDRLIDDMAVVLDVVIPEGNLSDRFHQLRDVILTRQKYETNRFR